MTYLQWFMTLQKGHMGQQEAFYDLSTLQKQYMEQKGVYDLPEGVYDTSEGAHSMIAGAPIISYAPSKVP